MVSRTNQSAAADPEVLGIIFVVGGLLAVATFILYDVATQVGQELETPAPFQRLQRVLARPFELERAA